MAYLHYRTGFGFGLHRWQIYDIRDGVGEGAQTPEIGVKTLLSGKSFAKNCMKM